MRRVALSSCLLLVLIGCGSPATPPVSAPELLVLCGAANTPPMKEIAAAYERERGVRVTLTMGGSGTLLSQCQLTGRGDVYLPGSPDYIIIGERQGLLVPGSDSIVAYLVPAIIVPRGNPQGIRTLEDLARPGVRVGIGNPSTVCLGLYSIELLVHNRLLGRIMPNIVTFGESCEKTANLAALGNVDAIIGWSVFANWNPERMEGVAIPPERIPRLAYVPIAIPVTARDVALSRDFIAYVLGPAGQAAYRKYGYHANREQARAFAPTAGIGGEYRLPPEYSALLGPR